MRIPLIISCIAIYFCSLESLTAQACECTNCPQFMQDLFVGDFNLNIQGATNNVLGQNGQGVCGVIVHFDHTAICDISISLTSPSGQTVTLVGPIGQFCTSNGNAGTDWNVMFVPCGSAVTPDPGFTPQWNNNQPWGGNNNYNGSYYPFAGCLQGFTGPVNGNWTLTVTDGQANDTGNLYDYEIIFCDPDGINCFSCAADAGILPQPDVISCQGDPELALDLPPTYNAPAIEPPAADYSYSYVISGSGGVIQSITSTPDMTGFPVGNYTVCGLSYLTAQQNLLPNPNGSLTTAQLNTQLNSNTPPFCGNITTNCVNVMINPIPPDEEETAEICAPMCYEFLGQFYCVTGDYTIDQTNASGCHYNAILHLTVSSPSFHTVTETICPGGCSTNPAFPGVCDPGQYQATLTNYAGCDSLLTLNLIEMNINAVIQPPAVITCAQPNIQLSGVGSTVGGGTSYLWTASNGGNISGVNSAIFATATSAGTYKLLVCRSVGGVSCCDSAVVNVTSNIILPATPVINGSNTICHDSTLVYSVTPDPTVTTYNWVVPAGVNIVSGQGTASISVQWSSFSNGAVCVTPSNACGPGQQACFTVSVLNVPGIASLNGPLIVCKDSLETYAVDTMPGLPALNWVVTGGTIVSGNGSYVIQVQWNGMINSGMVCVNASNACGAGPQSCFDITINAAPAAPQLSGDTSQCAGLSSNYTIAAIAGAFGYVWTVPVGATIVSGQNTPAIVVNWTSASIGTVCVNAVNSCGDGPQACIPVTIYAQPIAAAGIDSSICGISYSLSASQSVTGSFGQWSVVSGPGTANFTNSTSANTNVSVDLNGIYQFQWTETNGICADADTVQIAFNASPVAGMLQSVCDGTNQFYNVSFPLSGGTAPYTIPGGTITNGIFTSANITNGQSYIFIITDANGCVSPAVSGVYNCNCATNAGQMNLQLLTACEGDSIIVQASQGANLDSDDIGAFILHTNTGALLGTILDENATGVFHFGNGMTYGTTYYISYVVGNNLNGLPDLQDPCLSVAPGQPAVFYANPVPDAGMDLSGCMLTLTTNATLIPGTITWTVSATPSGGNAVISDPQSANTAVTASIFGAYTLTYTVSNNGCTGSDDLLLNFGASPLAGPLTEVCDGTNQVFTVNFDISGGQGPYTVNGQAVTGTTFTSAPLPNGSNYSFVISDVNNCMSAPVNGIYSCNCATSAGQVSLAPITACQSDSITVQVINGQNLDADDVTAYVLHTGSGSTLGTVLFQNHSGRFGYWATMMFGTTYYVSAVAGNNLNGFPDLNDPCLSVSQGQPIVFIQNPVPDAGEDFVVCGLTANLPATNGMFAGTWSQVSGPANANFGNTQSPVSSINAPVAGIYIFRWSEINGLCSAFDELEVEFLDNPVVSGLISTCNGTNTAYTVSFIPSSGANAYVVDGLNGSFNGTTYTSVEIPNDSTYSFIVLDAFGCQSPTISGTHHCNCSTSAGTMNTAPLVFCADQPAAVTWNNDGTLDADDVIQFILHDQAGGSLGTVLATGSQPIFTFGSGLQTGVTYYISAIAGSNVSGVINLSDQCLDIAPGVPVQWKALPFAAISGDATICNGSSTVLTFNGTGTYPLMLSYDNGTGTPVQLTIPNPQTIPLSVSPGTATTYTLISVVDGSAPTCSVNLNESVTVNVSQPVDAGTANAPAALCAGVSQIIPLSSLITGADQGGQWFETSVTPSSGAAFNAASGSFNTNAQIAGDYTFRYTVQADLPCPSQSTTVEVSINPTPVANAGSDQTIDCNQDSVTLGGSGNGSGVQYNWTLAGSPVGNTAQIITEQSGVFTLTVSNDFACSDSDEATVSIDNDTPSAKIVQTSDVRCFGENNGSIVLDSILSMHKPVLFSLNGGTFEAIHEFLNLEPGTYVITLQDSKGCEWSTAPQTVTEPSLLSVNLGSEIVVTFGDSVFLEADATVPLTDLSSLEWRPVLDPAHADTYRQDFLPLTSTNVNLEVVDSNGCKAASTVLIRVQKPDQVYVPNIIKPNSSNFNDRLTVYGGRGVAEVESFLVFDRWGEQLFQLKNFLPNDPTIGWDGTQRGDQVMPGVYVYVATIRFIDGETAVYKGDVSVLR